MLVFVAKRLLSAIPTLLAVLTVIFIIIRVVPGDPAIAILGNNASAEAIAALRERLGLNAPLYVQYLDFLRMIGQGDLGNSMVTGRPILAQVGAVLPYTIELTVASILIGVVLGLPIGVIAAVRRNTAVDYLARIGSLLGLSFPAFYTSIVLILVFSIDFGWFPVISRGVPLTDPLQRLYNLALPALSLGLIMVGYVARASRSSMLEVLGEDYVRTARAKGLRRKVIILRHVLRNALIPIVTVIGLYLGLLVGNSVLTEIVFNRPGLGKLIVEALSERDYTLLQGLMIVFAFFIVLVNMLTDLTYGLIDPRVRHQ
jgi:peptide/nickel transport system permease protein